MDKAFVDCSEMVSSKRLEETGRDLEDLEYDNLESNES
jgi:hypothetical protein